MTPNQKIDTLSTMLDDAMAVNERLLQINDALIELLATKPSNSFAAKMAKFNAAMNKPRPSTITTTSPVNRLNSAAERLFNQVAGV